MHCSIIIFGKTLWRVNLIPYRIVKMQNCYWTLTVWYLLHIFFWILSTYKLKMLFLADAVWAFLSLTSVSTYWTFNFTFEASSVSSSSILILKCPDVKICRAHTCRHSLVNHLLLAWFIKRHTKRKFVTFTRLWNLEGNT